VRELSYGRQHKSDMVLVGSEGEMSKNDVSGDAEDSASPK
jgi:hypothetical protein